ncbi:MAG: hypothetical protein ACREVL_11180 [Solimonas sp.]
MILIAALALFVLAWWWRSLPTRATVLAVAASAGFVAGLFGMLDDRWQAGAGVAVSVLFMLVLLLTRVRQHETRGGVPYVSGTLFGLLAALAVAAIVLFPVGRLPAPTGTHAVGVRSLELDDAARPGVFAAKPDEPRRLLVRVWYPAQTVQGLKAMPYFSAAEAEHSARSLGALIGFPPLLTYLKHARTNSYEGAPLLSGAQQLPTIFFSHGYTSSLGQNAALMEELASHGYVVYSVQHTYDSSATVFPDGDVLPTDPALVEQGKAEAQRSDPRPAAMVQGFTSADLDQRLQGQLQYAQQVLDKGERIATESAPVWVADRIFVHDRLQRGEVPVEIVQIAAASDFAHTGEMGMSFGGSTSGGLCMVDPRCAAAVNLDGGDFHYAPFDADSPVPVLMFYTNIASLYRMMGVTPQVPLRGYNDFSYERFENAGTRPDVYRVQMPSAEHLGLTDFPLFMRRPLRDPLLGTTPADVMIRVQRDFVRGFFDRHLRGIASDFPQPQLREYTAWVQPQSNADVRAWWLAKPAAEREVLEARIAELKAKAGHAGRRPAAGGG